MAILGNIAICRGTTGIVVKAAANGKADDSASFGFAFAVPGGWDGIVQLAAVPSTGTQTDITTCKPDLQMLSEDGTTWIKVATVDFVAVAVQLLQLALGVYKFTFAANALVTANAATVNIEAKP